MAMWQFHHEKKHCPACKQQIDPGRKHICSRQARPADERRREDDGSDPLVSGAVGYATGNPVLGALAGGDLLAASVGAALRDETEPSNLYKGGSSGGGGASGDFGKSDPGDDSGGGSLASAVEKEAAAPAEESGGGGPRDDSRAENFESGGGSSDD